MGGTASDLTVNGPGSSGTAITYNPASQLTGITRTNVTDLYAWTGHYNINRAYGTNGLNQLTSAGSTALGYDGRGNLTSSGPSVYTNTNENRLATAPGGATLTYDPTGRLSRVVKGLSDTQFEYLGPRLIIERDATGNILRRYVHGPGDDEPVVWFENSALTNKRFLHTDERGSVIALSDLSGASTATNKYDEYGIPQSSVGTLAPGTSGRFMYTGQTWIPEVGLYYYKARFYSPTLGRFMQTDPIGYKDGVNWYNYVDSDPINRVDPDGETGVIVKVGKLGWKLGKQGSRAKKVGWGKALKEGFKTIAKEVKEDWHALDSDADTSTKDKFKASSDLIFGTEFYNDKAKPLESAEHTKNATPSNRPKHEEGQAAKNKSRGGEKGDKNRRPPRKPPEDHKGPWPPKKK